MRLHYSKAGKQRLVLAAYCCFVLLGVGLMPGSAQAQGFFDFLFGGSKPSARRPAPAPRDIRPGPWQPPGARFSPVPRNSSNSGRSGGRSRSGSYRTVCVRLCDGYYFPISFGVRRGQFYADARACQSRCEGTDARLFHMPSSGSRIEDARDNDGRAYEALDNAFKYRKTYVPDCSCRPKPWSIAELARHREYAAEAARRAEEVRRKKEDELIAQTTGLDVAVARKLFEDPMAEALPPAPADDWRAPRRKRPLVVAEVSPAPERLQPLHSGERRRGPSISRVRSRRRPVVAYRQRRNVQQQYGRRRRRPSSGNGWFAGLGAGAGPKYRWPGD
ncbi:MAG: DUF2865 domain-containing protein [Hyphomicrobiaceae bacterium]|nr:DUF2865 domain-containing protein [Hyphomicrobiaceae bacterium]